MAELVDAAFSKRVFNMGSIPITTFFLAFTFFVFVKNFNFRFFFVSLRYRLSFFVIYLDKLKFYHYYFNTQLSCHNTFIFFHIFFYYFANSSFIGTLAFNFDKKILLVNSDKTYFIYPSSYFVYSNNKTKFFNFFNKYFIFFI